MAIKSQINLVLLFSLFLILGCGGSSPNQQTDDSFVANPEYGKWQDVRISPIQFERVLTIGNNDDFILPSTSQIEGPVTDEVGNIYFIDEKKGKLYSFDPQGNKRWETGNPGKGPGDFQNPRGLVTEGEYLYTANIQGSRIDQFNFEGELVNSTTLENFDLSFSAVIGFIDDSLLVTASTMWGQIGRKVNIFNTNDTLTLASQFDIFASPKFKLPQGFGQGMGISVLNSFITAANVENYKLFFYDTTGEKQKTITRDFDNLFPPAIYQSGSRSVITSYSSLGPPSRFQNDYFYTTVLWPTNVEDADQFLKRSVENSDNAKKVNFNRAIDFYHADGTLLYTLENEGANSGIGSIAYVDSEGFLYTKSNTPFPQIRKYKVTISPPTTEMDDALNQ